MNPRGGDAAGWRADFAAHPAFAPFAPWLDVLRGDDWPEAALLNRLAAQVGARNAAGLPIFFAPQHARCGQRDYEAGILASGVVPTRAANWHDLFNALCWLAYPSAKAALNALHGEALGGDAGGRRPPRSDAATLFDESGLVLAGSDDALGELLAAARWREAFVVHRAAWRRTHVRVIGHAVLEKLLTPWPGITAKCLFVRVPDGEEVSTAWLDERVASIWRDGAVTRPAELFPLPVLGIPGWWPANEDPAFYDDERHFRPRRAAP